MAVGRGSVIGVVRCDEVFMAVGRGSVIGVVR